MGRWEQKGEGPGLSQKEWGGEGVHPSGRGQGMRGRKITSRRVTKEGKKVD